MLIKKSKGSVLCPLITSHFYDVYMIYIYDIYMIYDIVVHSILFTVRSVDTNNAATIVDYFYLLLRCDWLSLAFVVFYR